MLKQKKKLHNSLLDLGGKIRVYARIRPISQKETGNGEREACLYVNEQALSLEANFGSGDDTEEGREVREFEYDSVFGPHSSQESIFDEVRGELGGGHRRVGIAFCGGTQVLPIVLAPLPS